MNFRIWTAPPRNLSRAALCCLLLLGASEIPPHAALAQAQPAAASSGLLNSRAIAYNPASGKVYAVDTSRGSVQIYTDATRQARRVQVGREPVSVAVNTVNGQAYVANAGDGTVSVLDGNSDAVLATIQVGPRPYTIAADSATGKVFVTHTFSDDLSVLDCGTRAVTALKIGSYDLISINSTTGKVYLLGYGGAVTVLDEATQKLTKYPVGRHAWGLTLSEATDTVYVTRIEDADVAAVTPDSSRQTILPAGAIPSAIAVDAKTNTLYVANYGENTVSVIDANIGRVKAKVKVGDRPKAIAFDPQRNLVYVANTLGNTVTVIDAAKAVALATLAAGKSPSTLAVVPGSTRLYVANETDSTTSTVIDLSGIRQTAQ